MTVAELIPEAMPAPDPIADALANLKEDPGAIFEPDALALLRRCAGNRPGPLGTHSPWHQGGEDGKPGRSGQTDQ